MLLRPLGSKQWRLRYKIAGRESMISLGSYPATSLKAARGKRTEMRGLIEAGKVPAVQKRAERASRANSIEVVARQWLAKQVFTPKTSCVFIA